VRFRFDDTGARQFTEEPEEEEEPVPPAMEELSTHFASIAFITTGPNTTDDKIIEMGYCVRNVDGDLLVKETCNFSPGNISIRSDGHNLTVESPVP